MHHPKGFPSRLVWLRAEAGMTQKDLAKASGLSVPQIGRYEMGSSKPRMTALVKLAKALGCDVSQLSNADDQEEIVGLELVSPDSASTPLALPAEVYQSLREDADRHGVPVDVMLAATITWYHSKVRGNEISIDEAVNIATENLKNWPA